ncbi:MAG: Binding-protein-dependent transport systems inner membrane component [bacterium 42_11]|nr:MAG: Binding-protein-dependent transport systems inner membrane component [bacterium 42_11]
MTAYILRRLLILPVILLGVTFLVFFMMQFLDPVQRLSAYIKSPAELKSLSADDLEKLVDKYGLNKPLLVQYFDWLKRVLRFDLGWSEVAHQPVRDAILSRFPATLELALFAVFPVVWGGIWLGIISAVNRDKPLDQAIRIFAVIGWSLPSFVFGILVLFLLYGVLGLFPPGRLSLWAQNIVSSPDFKLYTGLYVVDGILNGRFDVALDALRHLVGPIITLSYLWWAFILRITRSSMLEVLHKEYIVMARAKGVPEKLVIHRHAKKNALIPVLTVAGMMVLGLLGGVVITETIFDYPGIGRLAATAAQQLDYPLILGITIFYAFLLVLGNLVIDVLYAVVDPRVRLE